MTSKNDNYIEYIANQEGQLLYKHCLAVAKMCSYYAKEMGVPEHLQNLCFGTGLFHDVGKVSRHFQNFICSSKDEKSRKLDFYHNEISWVNLYCRSKNDDFKNIMCPEIFWHHYLRRKREEMKSLKGDYLYDIGEKSDKNLFSKIGEFSNNLMMDVNDFVDFYSYLDINKKEYKSDCSCNAPSIFSIDVANVNPIRLIIRGCLHQADDVVSKMSIDELDQFLSGAMLPVQFDNVKKRSVINIDELKCPIGYSPERFEEQKEIAKKCIGTTVVNAVGGYGKTMIGILYPLSNGKQLFWVCPRNSVATDDFNSICKEIKSLQTSNPSINISAELYLTGDRKGKFGDVSDEHCSSDIVVTNLDNLLSPVGSQRAFGRMYSVNSSCVICDEYHEFKNQTALFATYLIFMRMRHRWCDKSETLCLSATPDLTHLLWDSTKKKTLVLPGEFEHYASPYNQSYSFHIDKFNVDESPIYKIENKKDGSIVSFNSVANTQKYYVDYYKSGDIIAHGSYQEEDFKNIMKDIYDVFGKENAENAVNNGFEANIITCQVIKAATDISGSNLYTSMSSFETLGQQVPRQNRFNAYKGATDIYVTSLWKDRSERMAIMQNNNKKLYPELYEKFHNFTLEHLDGKTLTMDQFYCLYNKFNKDNQLKILEYLIDIERKAILLLSEFYPMKTKSKEYPTHKCTGITLRNSSFSYYYVIRDSKGLWCEIPFQEDQEEMEEDLWEENRIILDRTNKLKKIYKELSLIGYGHLDNNFIRRFLKSNAPIPKKDLLRCARNESMPIPIITRIYDKRLGILKKENMKLIDLLKKD